ncbi:MAG: AAA family ATPase [Paracoccaceae bacterium]
MPRAIVITGCSGGGKSTLLAELSHRGHATIQEPGRRIIATGGPCPWEDPKAFALAAIEMAREDIAQADGAITFFDRSALDALVWFERTDTHLDPAIRRHVLSMAYDKHVIIAPPWPEIYVQDTDRRHDLTAALAEYDALCDRLPKFGFSLQALPKDTPTKRADWVEAQMLGEKK